MVTIKSEDISDIDLNGWKVSTNLPHEIVEGKYRPRDVERRVERICKIIPEGICSARVEDSRALLVA